MKGCTKFDRKKANEEGKQLLQSLCAFGVVLESDIERYRALRKLGRADWMRWSMSIKTEKLVRKGALILLKALEAERARRDAELAQGHHK